MEKKIDIVLSILKEHSQLLHVLEHRTEVTGAEVTAIKEDINHMKGDITRLKEEQAVIKNDLGAVKDDLGVVKTDLAMVKDELGVVKTDLATVKDELGVVKTDLAIVKDDLGVVKNDQMSLSVRVDKNHDEVIARLDDLDEMMDYVMLNVARHGAKLLAKKKLS